MSKDSKIEWTNHTFNPWRGCSKVHAGCANCYAERDAKRFPTNRGVWGPNGTRVMAAEEMWRQPLKWNRAAEKSGERARVFCASLADVFEDWNGPIVDSREQRLWHLYPPSGTFVADTQGHADKNPVTMDDLRKRLFDLIDKTPWLDWQLVTKRPENVRRMWPAAPHMSCDWHKGKRLNVWLLTSVSNQETADKMIPELLKCRDLVPVLGLSMEPLLGPVDISQWLESDLERYSRDDRFGIPKEASNAKLDWAIVGGESGPGARPMKPDWVRSIRDQCVAAGASFFFKQWGEWVEGREVGGNCWDRTRVVGDKIFGKLSAVKIGPLEYEPLFDGKDFETRFPWGNDGSYMVKVGKKAAGHLLDRREWNEMPTSQDSNP